MMAERHLAHMLVAEMGCRIAHMDPVRRVATARRVRHSPRLPGFGHIGWEGHTGLDLYAAHSLIVVADWRERTARIVQIAAQVGRSSPRVQRERLSAVGPAGVSSRRCPSQCCPTLDFPMRAGCWRAGSDVGSVGRPDVVGTDSSQWPRS